MTGPEHVGRDRSGQRADIEQAFVTATADRIAAGMDPDLAGALAGFEWATVTRAWAVEDWSAARDASEKARAFQMLADRQLDEADTEHQAALARLLGHVQRHDGG